MRNYDMPRSKLFAQALCGPYQSLVIRDKNLQEIAKLGQFRWRTDKIRNGTRRAVPHENLKSFLAQVRAHRAADNSEADYSNNFSIWAEHTKSNALGGVVDTSVKVKLRAKTPGGNGEVCEFQRGLEWPYRFRSAQEIRSQTLQCGSAFFILNLRNSSVEQA